MSKAKTTKGKNRKRAGIGDVIDQVARKILGISKSVRVDEFTEKQRKDMHVVRDVFRRTPGAKSAVYRRGRGINTVTGYILKSGKVR